MPNNELAEDLTVWSHVFHAELSAHLSQVRDDPTVCGFAIEMPSDFSNDGLISRIAKRRTNIPLLKRVPSLDDWEYVPNGKTFDRSCDGLTELYAKHDTQLKDESFYENFGNRLYATILATMEECNSTGDFGNIDVRLLTLSDDEHAILAQAVKTLNAESNQKTAYRILEL